MGRPRAAAPTAGVSYRRRKEDGFTLVEMLIAMLLMAVVMVSLAPAFYGTLRAAASSRARTVATGAATTATEVMRSLPYWTVGYTSADYQTGGAGYACAGASGSPVVTVTTSDIDTLATTETLGPITYSIRRCVYWANSSIAADTDAYKQVVVTVSWQVAQVSSSISQTSSLYPGGETSTYNAPGENNFIPGATTTTTAPVAPSAPTWVSYADDPTFPTTEIDLVWSEPSTTPEAAAKYEVDYTTASNYGGSGYLTLTPGTYTEVSFNTPGTAASPNVITVSSGTTYYIEVWAVAADGTTSTSPTNVVSVTTAASAQACSVTELAVAPSEVTLSKNNTFSPNDYLSLSVNATSACNDVQVAYTSTDLTTVQFATVSGSGTLTGTASSSSANGKWAAGNHTFTVYVNGTQYSPIVQQQVCMTQSATC
jgi:prepilin-type N-terminal cleavage/methylation domain-containing protein